MEDQAVQIGGMWERMKKKGGKEIKVGKGYKKEI
jgi:hypothetical protein